VTNTGTDAPTLQHIQNPASRFEEGESIFATGFIIPEKQWRQQAVTESLA